MDINMFKGKNPISAGEGSKSIKQIDYRIDSMLESVILSRAASLARGGKLAQAEAILIPLTDEACENAAALDLLAKIYIRLGRLEEARRLWELAVRMEPSNHDYSAALQRCLRITATEKAGRPGIHFLKPLLLALIAIVAFTCIIIAGIYSERKISEIGNQIKSINEKIDNNIGQTIALENALQKSQTVVAEATPVPQPEETKTEPAPEQAPDITPGVEEKLKAANSINWLEFAVVQNGDTVSIAGAVPTYYLRDQVEQAARLATGVNYVDLKGLTVTGIYQVQSGDSLWSVSLKVYGDSYLWKIIAEANGIPDSGRISADQKLIIPTY